MSEGVSEGRELVFAPGSWTVQKARRNVAASWGALTAIVFPVLLLALRGTGAFLGILLIGGTVAVTVPAALLWVLFGVMPMRVVITDDAVELRRGQRVRRRLSRHRRLRALTFQGEGAGQRVGPPQLVISDGRSAIRLLDGRWVEQHEPIVTALGLRAGPSRQRDVMRQHPYAFRWVERHTGLFVFLIIVLPVVLIILGAGVVGLLFG